MEAEIKALKLGLELAQKIDSSKVMLLTDSTEALWALNLGTWRQDACIEEIKECLQLLDDHPNWAVGGIGRESNGLTDWLAKKARIYKWKWSNDAAIPRDLPLLSSLVS
ncbi:hypothetical protein QQ045_008057 [Rhodiola kirilowii]